jgi:hypothetical protein
MTPEFKKTMELPANAADNLARIKERYAELAVERSNTKYGWIHRSIG